MIPVFGYINQTLIYNAWNNDFDIIRKGEFLGLFKQQLKNENIELSNLCIFDCTNEGIGTADIDKMCSAVKNEFPTLEIRVLFNIPTTKKTKYKYKCFPGHMVAHCHFVSHVNSLNVNWKDLLMNKHFLSLQRRASVGRLRFTKQLLDNFNKEQYIISCGSQPNKWLNKLQNLKDAIYPYTLPILVDGEIDNDSKQHYHTNEDFFKCLFNIVTETSSQTDDDSWREIFLTEKTFKAFAYKQLPIWFAVPGTVQEVRKLGFDVFDDIINHSYDSVVDQDTRMLMVINELKRLCMDYPISDLTKLRNNLWNRISKNMSLLNKLEREHAITKHNLILDLINEF